MWQAILKFVIAEVLGFISDKIREARALKKKSKEDQVLVKTVLQEPDRKKRAKDITDLLNS